ncbi:MAG: large conductance mechanosensitive channel protein MscL [Rhodospirillaceae bacterium]|nr:large conductance mechanosensitive channel protein MscL [Rhodospirillaceae bacterium]MBT6118749.1 large conductance mechanosensitive channel protein MscL [Rhodospirillaceae bacterium]
MFKEFKEFALRGNVTDMAVGIIIGAAFTKLVGALVSGVIMPPIGVLVGGIDFSNYFITLTGGTYATLAEAEEAGAAVIKYGQFLTLVIDFAIVAFVIFLLIRGMNNMRRKAEDPNQPSPSPTTKNCPFCISTIPIQASRCPNCTSELEAGAA